MGGLLQRAAEYRANQRKLRLVKAQSVDEYDELGGTPEERLQIIEEIEKTIASNRTEIGPDTLRVPAKKSGIGLALVVNLAALLILAGGAYYFISTFSARESSVATEATTVTSAEGRLLEQVREEAEAQLSEKNSQIAGIQDELDRISAERQRLQESVNTRLASQEEALRNEFDAALQAERERLQSGGLDEAEIEARLAQFESEQQAAYDSQIAQIRAQAEEELRQREAELTAQISRTEQQLAAAQSERAQLETDFQAREARLSSEFAAREAELGAEAQAAQDRLAALQDQQAQEQLVQDRITSLYSTVRQRLQAGDFEAALAGTADLRQYLSQGPAAALPSVQRRRQVELFLVNTLEQRIEAEQLAAQPDSGAAAEAASVVASVTELVAAANEAYGASNFERARTLYLAAINEIPAVQVGYERLAQLEQRSRDAESARVAALVQRGNSLYRSGSYSQAADAYGQALASLPSADSDLLSRVVDAGYQLRAAGDLSALRDLRAELEQTRSSLAESQSELRSARASVSQREEDLASRDATIAQLRSDLQARDAELATRLAEREELTARIASLQTQLDQAEGATTPDPQLQQQIADLEARLADGQEAIARQEDEIATLESQLAEREAAIERQSSRIAQQDSQIEDLQATASARADTVSTLRSSVADLNARLATAREQNAALQGQLDSVSQFIAFYQDRQQLVDEITSYQERFVQSGAGAEPEAEVDTSLELLETKLLILRVLNSPSVRAAHPDLADQLNTFLDGLVAEQQSEGARQALEGVNDVLQTLLAGTRSDISAQEEAFPPGLEGPEAVRLLALLREVAGAEDSTEEE